MIFSLTSSIYQRHGDTRKLTVQRRSIRESRRTWRDDPRADNTHGMG